MIKEEITLFSNYISIVQVMLLISGKMHALFRGFY